RRQHAARYGQLLANTPGLVLPASAAPHAHVWHLYVVQVETMDREEFRSRLAERGVATGVHYPTPVPLQPVYAHLGYQRGAFPVSESAMERCVSLPMYPELTTEQVEYVAHCVREVLGQAG